MRYLLGLVLVAALIAGGLFMYAGHLPGPAIEIVKPVKYVGQTTTVEVAVTAPGARLSNLQISFEQNGKQTPLVSLSQPAAAEIKRDGADRVRVTRTIGREAIPALKSGPARIVVTAERPVLFGVRQAQSTASHDVQVRLERPTIAVISTKHYINLGGSRVHRASLRPGCQYTDVRVRHG